MKLKNNCKKYIIWVWSLFSQKFFFHTRKNEIQIIIYKILQTGQNIQLGGLKKGFSNKIYHELIDSVVLNPAIAPIKIGKISDKIIFR